MRPISDQERNLLLRLGEVGAVQKMLLLMGMQALFVESLDDGGMGSFRIKLPPEYEDEMEVVGATAKSEGKDGVLLIATLFLNGHGFPCSVDIWKVDFSPIIELPDDWEVEDFPRFPGSGTGPSKTWFYVS